MSELQTLSANEKANVLALLTATREMVLSSVDAVSPALVEKISAEGCWNVLQCMEHLVNAEESFLRLWQKTAQPGTADREKDLRVGGMADRSKKASAPERALPQGRIKSLPEARERFVTARTATIDAVQHMPDEDLRGKVVQHWLLGTIDGYQVFLLVALHSQRHAAQITETAEKVAAPAGGHA